MKLAYSYWGFLSDIKLDSNHKVISTPDGNAFYSWAILKAFQSIDKHPLLVMPNRDEFSVSENGAESFNAWLPYTRYSVYSACKTINYKHNLSTVSDEQIFELWNSVGLNTYDLILHEWRMPIAGRNTLDCRNSETWQPDLWLQELLILYCRQHHIKLVIFDLDYKLTETDFACIQDIATIVELGNKWQKTKYSQYAKTVYIPFDFEFINFFDISSRTENSLIYVGNRYERDWCIDKYIPTDLSDCVIYGNWTEGNRDSTSRWPDLKFGKRLQTSEMHDVYSNAACTLLLAKADYCEHHFMTARLIEAVFYGTVPLFIEEYGEETIRKFAGDYASLLTVKSKRDVTITAQLFKTNNELRKEIITYLRKHLQFMDAKYFVGELI